MCIIQRCAKSNYFCKCILPSLFALDKVTSILELIIQGFAFVWGLKPTITFLADAETQVL